VYGEAAPIELEAQQPHSRASLICRSELPFSGGIACQAGEIPAWPGIFQEFADDIARGINEHTHGDLDIAVNPAKYDPRNVRTYFVKHGGRSGRWRERRLIWRTRNRTRQLRI
jgi:hypothetical protein